MTQNKVINIIKNYVEEHPILKKLCFGNIENITDLNIKYPIVNLEPLPNQLNENIHTFNYRLDILDVMNENLLDYQYILSDEIQIINDIINLIKYDSELFLNINSKMTPFQYGTDDFCVGLYVDLSIKTERNMNLCSVYQ